MRDEDRNPRRWGAFRDPLLDRASGPPPTRTSHRGQFIYDSNVLLFGTDPVAVDAVAHDIIAKERMARGTQAVDNRGRSAAFLEIAEGLGLGVAAREKIKIADVSLG